MQRTVVVLQGPGESGKTTTIVKAWKLLRGRPGVTPFRRRKTRPNGEPYKEIKGSILKVDGVKVGFMSKSEPESLLRAWIIALIDAGCLVIVCATRSKESASDRFIESLEDHGWRIDPVRKIRLANEDQERAEEIVEKVLAAVEQAEPVEAK